MSLSIGGIISQTFSMAMQRIGSLLGVWAIYFGLQLLLMIILFGVVGTSFMMAGSMENPLAMGMSAVLTMILGYMAYFLLYMAQAAALVHNASPAHDPSLGDSFMAGLRAVPILLGLALIMLVAYFLAAIVLGLVGAAFSAAGDAGSVIYVILVFLLMIYISCRLSLVMPVIAVDGVGNPITALSRSWTLTSGHVLKIFVVMLLYAVIVGGVFFLLFLVAGGSMMGLSGMGEAGMGAAGATMIGFFLGFIALMVLVAIVSASFMASLHASLVGPEAVAETFA